MPPGISTKIAHLMGLNNQNSASSPEEQQIPLRSTTHRSGTTRLTQNLAQTTSSPLPSVDFLSKYSVSESQRFLSESTSTEGDEGSFLPSSAKKSRLQLNTTAGATGAISGALVSSGITALTGGSSLGLLMLSHFFGMGTGAAAALAVREYMGLDNLFKSAASGAGAGFVAGSLSSLATIGAGMAAGGFGSTTGGSAVAASSLSPISASSVFGGLGGASAAALSQASNGTSTQQNLWKPDCHYGSPLCCNVTSTNNATKVWGVAVPRLETGNSVIDSTNIGHKFNSSQLQYHISANMPPLVQNHIKNTLIMISKGANIIFSEGASENANIAFKWDLGSIDATEFELFRCDNGTLEISYDQARIILGDEEFLNSKTHYPDGSSEISTIAHEIMHATGHDHPFINPIGLKFVPRNGSENFAGFGDTVIAYFECYDKLNVTGWNAINSCSHPDGSSSYPQTLMPTDWQRLQSDFGVKQPSAGIMKVTASGETFVDGEQITQSPEGRVRVSLPVRGYDFAELNCTLHIDMKPGSRFNLCPSQTPLSPPHEDLLNRLNRTSKNPANFQFYLTADTKQTLEYTGKNPDTFSSILDGAIQNFTSPSQSMLASIQEQIQVRMEQQSNATYSEIDVARETFSISENVTDADVMSECANQTCQEATKYFNYIKRKQDFVDQNGGSFYSVSNTDLFENDDSTALRIVRGGQGPTTIVGNKYPPNTLSSGGGDTTFVPGKTDAQRHRTLIQFGNGRNVLNVASGNGNVTVHNWAIGGNIHIHPNLNIANLTELQEACQHQDGHLVIQFSGNDTLTFENATKEQIFGRKRQHGTTNTISFSFPAQRLEMMTTDERSQRYGRSKLRI